MNETQLHFLPVDQLIPTPDNPRVMREDQAFGELVESIKSVGILQPLIARTFTHDPDLPASGPREDHRHWDDHALRLWREGLPLFDLRAGHRRLLAAQKAGLKTVPVIVREMDDKTAMEITVAENLQRENLHPLEEAVGIQKLLDVGWDAAAIADRLGKSPAWVARRAKLRELSPNWRKAIVDPENDVSLWPANLLERIARLPAETQDFVLEELPSYGSYNKVAVPNVQELDRFLQAEILHTLGGAPFKLDDDTLIPSVGACSNCIKRSSCQPLLFEELEPPAGKKGRKGGGDRCLDLACYAKKVETFSKRKVEELKAEHGKVAVLADHYLNPSKTAQLKKCYGSEPVIEYQVSKAKAGEKGAMPAVVVDSHNAGSLGQVVWIKPHEHGPAPCGVSRKSEPGAPTPLKDRREALMKRRKAHVIEAVQAKLKDVSKLLRDDRANDSVSAFDAQRGPALALAFGTAHRHDRGGHCLAEVGADSRSTDPWKALAKYSNATAADLGRELVRSVIPVIADRLVFFNGDDAVRKFPEAREVCKLFGFDLNELERAAEAEIPEPKSWANLQADGTPKGASREKTLKPADKPKSAKSKSTRKTKKG